MNEHHFQEQTRNVLLAAGWFAGRTVDLSIFLPSAIAANFKPFDCAVVFLQEFTGLQMDVRPIWIPTRPNLTSKLQFTPSLGWLEPGQYEDIIGERTFPIGGDCHAALVIGESGSVYGMIDDIVWRYGRNTDEALDNMITFGRTEQIAGG